MPDTLEKAPDALYVKQLDSLRAIVWRGDPRTSQTTFTSKGIERILGYPAESLPGAPRFWLDRIHPEDRDRVLALSSAAIAEKRDHDFECRMIGADGSIVWLRNIVTVVVENDAPVDVLGFAIDISEYKHAEQEWQESEERFRMASHAGRMFAYEWDASTDRIVRSDGAAAVLGAHEGTHTTGRRILEMIPPEDQERLTAAVARLSPEEPYLRISYRMIRSDGVELWVDRTSRAFFDETGRLQRLIGMIVDVTERERAEQALRSMSRKLIESQEQERARIARELHDDIGQRLALLLVELQGMEEGLADSAPELQSRISDLEKLTSKIANDVQALSHELHSAQLEYLGLVAAMRGFCAELSKRRKVKIAFRHEGVTVAVPQEVSLCVFRVAQEALNNALKHSGVRHFEVTLQESAAGISLTVRDSGVGFDPELARTSRGLGLVSMRERVNLVKGELSIRSTPQSGTEVSVRVPLSGLQTEAKSA